MLKSNVIARSERRAIQESRCGSGSLRFARNDDFDADDVSPRKLPTSAGRSSPSTHSAKSCPPSAR